MSSGFVNASSNTEGGGQTANTNYKKSFTRKSSTNSSSIAHSVTQEVISQNTQRGFATRAKPASYNYPEEEEETSKMPPNNNSSQPIPHHQEDPNSIISGHKIALNVQFDQNNQYNGHMDTNGDLNGMSQSSRGNLMHFFF